ncbi:ELMO domain-containing protein 1 [Planococcus citri]|uniref:ELMO domain-containing protein 1 n=1 Tax=Planococcus citri TaxID=170843 RepID=UPI0031F8F529
MRLIFSWIYWTCRSFIKVILRRITKLCELQRICYSTLSGADRSLQVEYSLQHSKRTAVRDMIRYMDELSRERRIRERITEALNYSVILVITCKKINPRIHVQFVKSFSRCLEHIWGYKQLMQEVCVLSRTPYDSENEEHEMKLLKLWNALMPDTPLQSRVSKQWQDIGFQGNDPKTDFRGMGMLGLENLLFFAQEYSTYANIVLTHSLHPTRGYTFAVLGINITNMAYHLLLDGTAKTHFFNISHRMPNIEAFHRFYCYLFFEFDKFWMKSKPQDMMDFNHIKQSFESEIRESLGHRDCILNIKNCVVETI